MWCARTLFLAVLVSSSCARDGGEVIEAEPSPLAVAQLGDVVVRYVAELPPAPPMRSVPWFSEGADPVMRPVCDRDGELLRVLAGPGGYESAAAMLAWCPRGDTWELVGVRLAHLSCVMPFPAPNGVASGTIDVRRAESGALELVLDLRSGSFALRGGVTIDPAACDADLDWFEWSQMNELAGACR